MSSCGTCSGQGGKWTTCMGCIGKANKDGCGTCGGDGQAWVVCPTCGGSGSK